MKNKKVLTGWISKDIDHISIDILAVDISINGLILEKYRGRKNAWNPVDWPPRRATVTIEWED